MSHPTFGPIGNSDRPNLIQGWDAIFTEKVVPARPIAGVHDDLSGDTEPNRKFMVSLFGGNSCNQHLRNLAVRVFCARMFLSPFSVDRRSDEPSSRYGVPNIVSVSPGPKMIRVHADWVIAGMKSIHSCWNWATQSNLKRESVGETSYLLFGIVSVESSISGGYSSSLPFPAFVCAAYLYAGVKLINDGLWMRCLSHNSHEYMIRNKVATCF